MSDPLLSRQEWHERLKTEVWDVVFLTAYGNEKKTMRVSLRDDCGIPPKLYKETVELAKDWNGSAVTCWSVDRKGWRSFLPEKVVSAERVVE